MTSLLAEWIVSFFLDSPFRQLVDRFTGYPQGAGTPPHESAMLYALLEQLRPPWSLEIGSFFCHTTRIMAESIRDNRIDGKVITLDPFGQDRVPAILQSWPSALRVLVDYRPWNSMQYFLELETLATPKGAESPLGLAFVDGHHNFEYALYDIIRAADHLRPGGAIVVDNLEQDGPKTAALQFLRWNPAWAFFCQGKVLTTQDGAASTSAWVDEVDESVIWGVLLSPAGLQVAAQSTKLSKRDIPERSLSCLRFHVRHVSHPGSLLVNLSYYAVPYDFSITGVGIESTRNKRTISVTGNESLIDVTFAPAVALNATCQNVNVCYELELAFRSEHSPEAYLLLDGGEPITLISA